MTARNRAILWLGLPTGLRVSELCGLRLADVDRAGGTVTVRGKGGQTRTIPLSADGQRAVCAYLDQARLTPAWEPAVPEARDRLLLPFARRNIFCSNRLYQNTYEMYEWIQEAIVKGMTDVHEIQRYARQKEINLYGA
jgi:site-specific recombinase XerD